MQPFQLSGHQKLKMLASEFQLSPSNLIVSGNGTQYDNHLNRTIFTVYHDRIAENNGYLEIAIGEVNIAKEWSLPLDSVERWTLKLQKLLPTATRKSPENWPRICVQSDDHIAAFAQQFHLIYQSIVSDSSTTLGRPQVEIPAVPIDERVLREIATRRGQPLFRSALIAAYGCCAISKCNDIDALEAAHLRPHSELEDYRVCNGLLLRADIHTLFDLRLVSIDPESGTVCVSQKLGPTYQGYAGQSLHLPENLTNYPDPSALLAHFRMWQRGESDA